MPSDTPTPARSTELALLAAKVEPLGHNEAATVVDYIAAALSANLDRLTYRHSSAVNAMLAGDWRGTVGDADRLLVPIADATWPAVHVLETIDELLVDLNGARGETGVAAIRHITIANLRLEADALQTNVANLLKKIDQAVLDPNGDCEEIS